MISTRSKYRSYLRFVLPAFIIYASIMVFPLIFTVGLSFTKWKGYGPIQFVGLQNYAKLLSDPVFHIGFRNNVLIVLISVFGQIPLGFLLAYMLYRHMVKAGNFFEIMIFLPITISSVIVAQLWNRVFAPVGILPTIIRQISGNQEYSMKIFENKDFAFVPIMFVLLWQYTSLYMVIFLANLQRIPESIIEAAQLEGATEGVIFTRIVAPILAPVAFINAVLAISGSFKSFDLVYSMTGGGPAHYTEVMAVYMYNTTFVFQNYGYGSAIAVVIIIFIILSILLMRLVSNKFNLD